MSLYYNSQKCLNGEKLVEGNVSERSPTQTNETPDKESAENTSPALSDTFNLSNKIMPVALSKKGYLKEEDVQEFIRQRNRLDELFIKKLIGMSEFLDRRNKLAGDKFA